MDDSVSAAQANRNFSGLLRQVREGHSVIVTSHGKPVAKIVPISQGDARTDEIARRELFKRLQNELVIDVGRWTRDELYED